MTIKITVAGTAGSGKSAISYLFAQTLKAHGINAELSDDNGLDIVDERPGVIAQTFEQRINSISEKKQQVSINTKQIAWTSLDISSIDPSIEKMRPASLDLKQL